RLGSLIQHIRARDATLGSDRRTQPALVGTGAVNWSELFSDLDGASYHGWFTLDPTELPNRTPAAINGLKYLKAQ
ncbi:MAG TPA: hypothetical protein VHW73_08770, partial [Rudaea sp.]|nr:hypothetical protein [Rudaea sp.]